MITVVTVRHATYWTACARHVDSSLAFTAANTDLSIAIQNAVAAARR